MRLRLTIAAAGIALAALGIASFNSMRTADTVHAGVPTETSTPTATRTPTSTRTPTATVTPQTFHNFVNNSGDAADTLDLTYVGLGYVIVTAQPASCGAATIDRNSELRYGGQYPDSPVYWYTEIKISWPTACVAIGEQVTLGANNQPPNGSFGFFFSNTVTSTSTPTPTYTPTPTATYPGPGTPFTNDDIPLADGVDLTGGPGTDSPESELVSVLINPPGCATPTVGIGSTTYSEYAWTPTSGWILQTYTVPVISIRWPEPCVELGESVVVDTGECCFGDTFNLSAPILPTVTPSPVPIVQALAIDCDPSAVGIQSNCTVPIGAGSLTVDVLLYSQGLPLQLGAMGFIVDNPDVSRLVATSPPCDPAGLDCNPDFDQDTVTGNGWECSPPPPTADFSPSSPGQQTFLGCFNGSADGGVVPSGSTVRIASFSYDIPPGAPTGTVALTIKEGSVYDAEFGEKMSCYPILTIRGECEPALITLADVPTLTPTLTPTTTTIPAASSTITATPTAEGPGVEKIPDGNENNTDLSIPAANLWICEAPAACAGPGEGGLRVVERASGVVEGLGAYEFTVEYDNFVIQSVNPCDLVFSPGGAGSARGPVDELNASAINPDCAPDPGGANNGTCAMSLILENIIHFGCVSGGQNLGPTGDMDLASLLLIPHPDLNNDLFPGNNNGVLTVLKDNGCELVDTLGHPVSGSVNGGLTPYCRDLAVTVRILEGDLDLDCDVDLTDAQAIASRYGAFFGGLLYSKWYDLEPEFHDLDIDIKDVQKIFGRQGSTCDTPIPAQPPLGPPTAFQD